MGERLGLAGRALFGAVGLLWAFTTAIGSGVNDVLTILGLRLNPAQQVFAGTVVFGIAVLWDNALLRAKLNGHTDAPNLLWQGVRVSPANHGKGFELTVACKNDGPTARVDRASAVEATFTWSFSDKPPQRVPTTWDGFDDGGYIETGVFILNMLCPDAKEAADHEVVWRVVYWDPRLRHAYVTECSATVVFAMGKPSVKGTPSLDPTSPEDRNGRYKREYTRGTGGRSTRVTTPRRWWTPPWVRW